MKPVCPGGGKVILVRTSGPSRWTQWTLSRGSQWTHLSQWTLRPDITASPRPLRSRAQKPKRGAIKRRTLAVDSKYEHMRHKRRLSQVSASDAGNPSKRTKRSSETVRFRQSSHNQTALTLPQIVNVFPRRRLILSVCSFH